MKKIAVLVSGGGTNLQALLDAMQEDRLGGGKIVLVISSRADAYALERAKKAGVETAVVSKKDWPDATERDTRLLELLAEHEIELVVLAGYLSILSPRVIEAYRNRIINIHPSLIPSFCGAGFYGLRVHEAVLEYGVKLTGATVHFVNEIPDGGAILLQKSVAVKNGDTPEILQKRVMEEAEWSLLPRAVALYCEDRITMVDGKAVITE